MGCIFKFVSPRFNRFGCLGTSVGTKYLLFLNVVMQEGLSILLEAHPKLVTGYLTPHSLLQLCARVIIRFFAFQALHRDCIVCTVNRRQARLHQPLLVATVISCCKALLQGISG